MISEWRVFFCIIVAYTSGLAMLTPLSSSSMGVRSRLMGVFDNKAQAEYSLSIGKPTAQQGGHEYVTATIREYSNEESSLLVAMYFLDGDVTKTFRYRHYGFQEAEEGSELCCIMTIARPRKDTLARLHQANFDQNLYLPDATQDMEYIQECDIGWRVDGDVYVGELIGNGNLVSEADPTRRIRVQDELRLGDDFLSINDRVYDEATGAQLIGNSDGIPYMLQKVL